MAEDVLARAFNAAKARPVTTGLATLAATTVVWAATDFWQWKSFGTGGTPPTIAGYLRMTRLRLSRLLSHDDLNDASSLTADGPAFLPVCLPARDGPHPKIISRTLPHREAPGQANLSQASLARLHGLARNLAAQHPDILEAKPSKTEGGSSDGLYVKKDISTLNPAALNKVVDGEIAHVHPSENSLHVYLSQPDARRLIELGWGQRFPVDFAPPGWIMVYAPRNIGEVELVEGIVSAAVEWVTGVNV